MFYAEFIGKTSNYSGDSAVLQLRFGTLQLLGFPKLKSPLKGKRFQTVDEIQENTMRQLMAIPIRFCSVLNSGRGTGRTVWGPKVPTFKGSEVSLTYVHCFLYLVTLINVSSFHITWQDTFWTDLVLTFGVKGKLSEFEMRISYRALSLYVWLYIHVYIYIYMCPHICIYMYIRNFDFQSCKCIDHSE